MICRIAAVLFLVCSLCTAQDTPNSEELNRRIHLADRERSLGNFTTAESMLAELEAEIVQTKGEGVLLAMALREQGVICDDRQQPERAIAYYERALAMFRTQPGVSPVVLALVTANLAGAHVDRGDFEVALSLATEAVSEMGAPTSPEVAVALYSRGTALHGLARNLEALRDLREAVSIWQHTDKPDHGQMALVNEAMATCFADLGAANQAEAAGRQALSERTQAFGPNSIQVASSLNNLGVILTRQQRFSEGQQLLTKATVIFEQSGQDELHRLADVVGNLGALYYCQARNITSLYPKAEEAYRRKLAIEERILGPSNVRVSATLEMLGEILYRERAYNEAGRAYGRGLAIQQAAYGPSDPKTQAAAKRYRAFLKKMRPDSVW